MSLGTGSRVAILISVLLFLAIFANHHRQSATMSMEAQPRHTYREGYLLPDPATLKIIGQGHDEMMADLIWLRALSYFANHFFLDQDYRWLDRYAETVINLDPNFKMVYQWAGVVTMYGGQYIDNQAVMNSIRFLEMGRERFPDDWLLNFMLGVNYRYELIPSNREERRQWRLLGATYLSRAAQAPDAPAWLTLNATRNLEVYGAAQEAIDLERQLFLSQRGVLAATLAADMQIHAHNPIYLGHPALNIDVLAGSGSSLRERLGNSDWARLLIYRRLMFYDLDNEYGYVYPALRTLMRGESYLRPTGARKTPIDHLFYPTLLALTGEYDQE